MKWFILAFILSLASASAVINVTTMDYYRVTSGTLQTTGIRGTVVDTTNLFLYTSGQTSDTFAVLNISNVSDITGVRGYSDSVGAGSIDGIWYGSHDVDRGIFYVPANVDDGLVLLNTTSSSVAVLSEIYDDTPPGSIDGAVDTAWFRVGTQTYVAVGATNDDDLTIYNVTNSGSAPVYVTQRTSDNNPCSTDNLRELYNIPGTTVIIGAAQTDATITIVNVTNGNTITCLDDYANTSTLTAVQNFDYDVDTKLLYVFGEDSNSMQILNLTDLTNIVSVGTYNGVGLFSGRYFKDGAYTYVFASKLAAGDVELINVTVPSSPVWVSNHTLGDGTCGTSTGTKSYMSSYDNYMFVSFLSNSCVLAAQVYTADAGGGGDTCTYTSGDWNVDAADNCVITSDVDLGGNNVIITGTGSFIVSTGGHVRNFARFVCRASGFCRADEGIIG